MYTYIYIYTYVYVYIYNIYLEHSTISCSMKRRYTYIPSSLYYSVYPTSPLYNPIRPHVYLKNDSVQI